MIRIMGDIKVGNLRKSELGVMLIVKSRIPEIVFWILNTILIIMSFGADRPVVSVVTTVICTMPMNPWILNRIQRKIDGNKFDFLYLLKWLLPFFTIIFVFYGSYLFYTIFQIKLDAILEETEDIEAFVKAFMRIAMYLAFIAVLVFYQKNDKRKRYIVFGLFYTFCVILHFCSETMVDMMVSFINMFSKNDASLETYKMLYSYVLEPIKEAILTYIILDVVFDEKDNRKKEEEVNEVESNPIEDIRTKEFSVDVLNEQTFKHEKYKIIVQK